MPFSAHSLGMKSRFVNLESSVDGAADDDSVYGGSDNDGIDDVDGTLMITAMMTTVMMMMMTVMMVTSLSC